jgi:hypothetical protein
MDKIKIQKDPLVTSERLVKKAQRIVDNIMGNSDDLPIALGSAKEAAQFLGAVAQLTRAAADLQRIKTERDGAILLAGRAIMGEIRRLIRERPDLYQEIYEIVNQAVQTQLEAQAQAIKTKAGRSISKRIAAMAKQSEPFLATDKGQDDHWEVSQNQQSTNQP